MAADNKDSAVTNQLLRIIIKQSKTDPFQQGVSLFLEETDTSLCPVEAILSYLVIRGNSPGPLYIMQDSRRLTRQLFSDSLNDILKELHLDIGSYNTHSFRIGAATSAKEAGISDSHIMMLGRWRTSAYHSYCTPGHLRRPWLNSQELWQQAAPMTDITLGT